MQKVHIIMRGCDEKKWLAQEVITSEDIKIFYCGYLEFEDDVDVLKQDIWDWCNWSCWCGDDGCPKECKNLLIDHCNSDMSFNYDGTWYCHCEKPFSSFDECYKIMKEIKNSLYDFRFKALWPFQLRSPKFLTPENIQSIF